MFEFFGVETHFVGVSRDAQLGFLEMQGMEKYFVAKLVIRCAKLTPECFSCSLEFDALQSGYLLKYCSL